MRTFLSTLRLSNSVWRGTRSCRRRPVGPRPTVGRPTLCHAHGGRPGTDGPGPVPQPGTGRRVCAMSETRFADVRRFGLDRLDQPLPARRGPGRSAPRAWWPWPTTRPPAGVGSGRSWEAPPGANLLLSVLLRPVLDPADRHLATTAVALAAVDAVGPGLGLGRLGGQARRKGRTASGRRRDQVAERPGRPRTGGSWPASWPRRTSARVGRGGPAAPVVVGIGINVNWPAPTPTSRPSCGAWPRRCGMLAGGSGRPRGAARRPARRPRPADRRPRTRAAGQAAAGRRSPSPPAPRSGPACGWTSPTARSTGTATGITPEGHLLVDVDGTARHDGGR